MGYRKHALHQKNEESSEFLLPGKESHGRKRTEESGEKHQESHYDKKTKKSRKNNQGNWSHQEERKFMEHMITHSEVYKVKELRRSKKIFKKMARYLRTRSSQQCRSHHQKYEIKFKCYDKIVEFIESKIRIPDQQESSSYGIHYSPIVIQNYLPADQKLNFKQFHQESSSNVQMKVEEPGEQINQVKNKDGAQKKENKQLDTKIEPLAVIHQKNLHWQVKIAPQNEIFISFSQKIFSAAGMSQC